MSKTLPRFLFAALLVTVVARGGAPAEAKLAEAMILTPQAGAEREDADIVRWQERVGRPDAKAEHCERLGWAFVAKARRTLDTGYFKLAESTADVMDARFGVSAESRLLRGHVWHHLHRFRAAEEIARQLTAERGAAVDFGLLSDALMEQGKLGAAVAALQCMVNLKPGAEAYSRMAHLRWLKGDLPGATAAMEMALRASSARDAANAAWLLARLSAYHLQAGSVPQALLTADAAMRQAPGYAPALLASGRALLASQQTEEAVVRLREAEALNPLPEYQWWLADALRATRRQDEARAVELRLRERGALSDPRTLALFLATRGENPAEALRLAREELGNRGDVLTHDTVAWAEAANGDFAAAESEIRQALAAQTNDPRLLLHAGVVAQALHRPEAAKDFYGRAGRMAQALTPGERGLLAARSGSAGAATPVAKAN